MEARDITRAFRQTLVPGHVRLRTHPDPSGDFTVTIAKAAALQMGLGNPAGQQFVAGVLSRRLGEPVHIAGTPRVRGQSAFVTVRPGTCPGPGCGERCATVGHRGRRATHAVSYTVRNQGPRATEYVCASCAESYGRRPTLTGFEAAPLASLPAAVHA